MILCCVTLVTAGTTEATTTEAATTQATSTMAPATTTAAATTVAPTTSSPPVTSTPAVATTGAPTTAPTEAPTTTEAVTTTEGVATSTAQPGEECPLDMTDSTKLPLIAAKPKPQSITPDYMEWQAPVAADMPLNIQIALAPADEPAFTTKIAITPSIEDVKVILTVVGKETQDGPETTDTVEMAKPTEPNQPMQVPSSTQKTLPYISHLSVTIFGTSETEKTVAVKIDIDSCLKTGELNMISFVFNYNHYVIKRKASQ